ncbi:hypothetical protein [Bdellovibrio bacteriovorus]|uniref:hypothetical protein n=1 Tax=Bdellovibrio bacteriovorus TaxID=959 RepID=UPI0035A7269F
MLKDFLFSAIVGSLPFARLKQKGVPMKTQWIAFFALALTFAVTQPGYAAKASKKELKAYSQACKSENPKASKKEIRKCVKEKAKASATT